MSAETLHVPLDRNPYDIIIGSNLLKDAARWIEPVLPAKRAIIVADRALHSIWLPMLENSLSSAGIDTQIIEIEPGEQSKSFAVLEGLIEQLLALKPDRKTTLIALGGGVIGDLVGFAASILLRGLPLIQIPTTLLSQIDSAVGGKTGINTSSGKNLVGSFYQPKRVLIDIATLDSLPDREMRAGYAEMVKYGALGDELFFDWLELNGKQVLERKPFKLSYAIKTCCSMKAQIVEWDTHEAGLRALLNFGHTFAHALEAEAGYNGKLLHGEAVAIGMVMAAELSVALEMCDELVPESLIRHLRVHQLPISPMDITGVDWEPERIFSHFVHDKKTESGALTFILLHDIGNAELVRGVDPQLVRNVIERHLTMPPQLQAISS